MIKYILRFIEILVDIVLEHAFLIIIVSLSMQLYYDGKITVGERWILILLSILVDKSRGHA